MVVGEKRKRDWEEEWKEEWNGEERKGEER